MPVKSKISQNFVVFSEYMNFTVMSGNFKFQVQDSDLEYLFLEILIFEKRIAFSDKKPPLITTSKILWPIVL